MLGAQDSDVRESEIRANEVCDIVRYDHRSTARDGELEDVIVAFIPQVLTS